MSIVVHTNMSSLVAQRHLSNVSGNLTKHMNRLSSGLRINSAADDAAGVALSEKLTTQVNASEIAKRNIQTGMNMIQTAEADLTVIQDNLQRMRDLAVQSANGVYSTAERQTLDAEYKDRIKEINRIASSSSFSDIKLLDGTTPTGITLQIGTNNTLDDQLDISSMFKSFKAGQNDMPATTATITTATTARAQITAMDTAINSISSARAEMGATLNRLQGSITRVDTRKETMTEARSTIKDADIAQESASMTRYQILQQSATKMLAQANQAPSLALNLLG